MNWLKIGKGALGFLTSLGVGNVVGNVVKASTPANLNTFNKISIQLGTFVLSGMIAKKAAEYLNSEIDIIMSEVRKEKTSQEKQAV